jgi:hypothetical protein
MLVRLGADDDVLALHHVFLDGRSSCGADAIESAAVLLTRNGPAQQFSSYRARSVARSESAADDLGGLVPGAAVRVHEAHADIDFVDVAAAVLVEVVARDGK